MKLSGIYKIESLSKPERFYIGSAVHITNRWNSHRYRLKKGNHDNLILQHHYNKYGLEDLKFSIILFGCKPEDLIFFEQIFITPKPYFNIRPTAENNLGLKMSEESKAKMRLKKLGKPMSEEIKAKHRLYRNSEETIQNMKIAQEKRRALESQETRDKIGMKLIGNQHGKAGKGKILSEETKAKMRKPKSEEAKQNMRNFHARHRLNR